MLGMSKRKFDREMEKLLIEHKRNMTFLSQQPEFMEINLSIPPESFEPGLPILVLRQGFKTACHSDQENMYTADFFFVEPPQFEDEEEVKPYHEEEFYEEEIFDEEFHEPVDGRSGFVIGIAKWVGESSVSQKVVNSLLNYLQDI